MHAQVHLTISQIPSDLIKCAADAYDNHSSQNPSSKKQNTKKIHISQSQDFIFHFTKFYNSSISITFPLGSPWSDRH